MCYTYATTEWRIWVGLPQFFAQISFFKDPIFLGAQDYVSMYMGCSIWVMLACFYFHIAFGIWTPYGLQCF